MDDNAALEDMRHEGLRGFLILYNRYAKSVHQYIAKNCSLPEEADDVLQETFVKFQKTIHQYHQKCNVLTWLCTIAKNLANDYWRNKKKHEHLDLDDIEAQTINEDDNVEHLRMTDSFYQQKVEEQAQQLENNLCYQICVKRALDRLERDSSHLNCIQHLTFLIQGESIKEIAQKINRTLEATRSHLYHCRQKLKKYLPFQQCWENCK